MKQSCFVLFAFALSLVGSGQNLQVDDAYSAQQLVENVLLSNSQCASASNFTVSGDTFDAGQNSYGYFTNANPAFPFTSGVILSTARAKRAEGPNDNLIDEGNTGWTGDADLQQALGISNTYNATSLEFDFTPATTRISFDYIFASEEYSGSAPCQYSDGFAFLLKPAGSPGPYQNLAVLPDSNTPVLVTTVHPAIGSSCPAANEQYFGGFNGSSYPVNFNGQTVVLTAKANVIPGTTYHIKLVIADEENIRYDSAIFLGAGTFHVGTDLGPDRLIAAGNPLCNGETYTLDATQPGAISYLWYKNNVVIPGASAATYTVNSGGTYRVEVTIGAAGCVAEDEVVIEYAPPPPLANATLSQCDPDHDGMAVFNLTQLDDVMTMNNPALSDIRYYPTLADAQAETGMIGNPSAYISGARTVIARAENQNGCPGFATVTLSIANNPLPQAFLQVCDDDTDGRYPFDLASLDATITSGLPPGLSVLYYATEADASSGQNPLASPFVNTVAFQQTIFATVTNGPDCYSILPVDLQVKVFQPAGFGGETVFLCDGQGTTLTVPAGFASYQWNDGSANMSLWVDTPGDYTVTATNADGCTATKTFHVLDSGVATIDSVLVHDFAQESNSAQVDVSGQGDYEFSLDGVLYQQSNVFGNVAPGFYQLYVRDVNGCGTAPPYPVYVLDYPRFFTPNGDGYNDVWEIKNLALRAPDAIVSIFDRFGKLLYQFRAGASGWNGKFAGRDLPSTDYWFVLELDQGRWVRGHFSLKR